MKILLKAVVVLLLVRLLVVLLVLMAMPIASRLLLRVGSYINVSVVLIFLILVGLGE